MHDYVIISYNIDIQDKYYTYSTSVIRKLMFKTNLDNDKRQSNEF